jgi:Ca2+-binding RTX toxin-like protein
MDRFELTALSEIGDLIQDFVAADDTVVITGAAFGGGLVAGTLGASLFQSRADNVAQDANDRFIFRTTDKSLWFDADGNGAIAAVLVVDMQQGATMTNADILIV